MALRPHHRLLQRGLLAYGRLTRGMTLGVRAALIGDGGVLLIRHSYIPGWYFPGGGVERGETVLAALQRELREEAGAVLSAPPRLFGIYRNAHADRRDHVAFFVSRDWERSAVPQYPTGEIVACETFALDRLPADVSPGTAARIEEVLGGSPPSADW